MRGGDLSSRQSLVYGGQGQGPVAPLEAVLHGYEVMLQPIPGGLGVLHVHGSKLEHFAALRGGAHAVRPQGRLGQAAERLPGGGGRESLRQAVVRGEDRDGGDVLQVAG